MEGKYTNFSDLKVFTFGVALDTVADDHCRRRKIKKSQRQNNFSPPLPFALPTTDAAALLVRTTRSRKQPEGHVTWLQTI